VRCPEGPSWHSGSVIARRSSLPITITPESHQTLVGLCGSVARRVTSSARAAATMSATQEREEAPSTGPGGLVVVSFTRDVRLRVPRAAVATTDPHASEAVTFVLVGRGIPLSVRLT
jgi:hypothetical protein